MGTLIFWGVIVLGVFLGIVIFSLLSMAQRGEQIYDLMHRGEEHTHFGGTLTICRQQKP